MKANERYLDGTIELPADANGKQIEILEMLLTSDTAGATVTFADDNPGKATSYLLHLNIGPNDICEWPMNFIGGRKVTITPAGGTVTGFIRYVYK